MAFPLATFFVASSLLIAVADSVPKLDVTPSCRAANRGGGPGADLKNCMTEEEGARQELVKQWTQFSASDRTSCVQMSTMGGEPSYVELLTCLEMAKAAKDVPETFGRDITPGTAPTGTKPRRR